MTVEKGCQNTAGYTLNSTIISHMVLLWAGSVSLSVKKKKKVLMIAKNAPKTTFPTQLLKTKAWYFIIAQDKLASCPDSSLCSKGPSPTLICSYRSHSLQT